MGFVLESYIDEQTQKGFQCQYSDWQHEYQADITGLEKGSYRIVKHVMCVCVYVRVCM